MRLSPIRENALDSETDRNDKTQDECQIEIYVR